MIWLVDGFGYLKVIEAGCWFKLMLSLAFASCRRRSYALDVHLAETSYAYDCHIAVDCISQLVQLRWLRLLGQPQC